LYIVLLQYLTIYRIHEKWRTPGSVVGKGDELGIFQFGASSIIVAFRKGSIRFDEDLLKNSQVRIQTSVEVGMSLGSV
jgi:phosphatidylserine decarboxylase